MGTGAAQPRTGPPEQRLADRLTARQMGASTSTRATAVAMLGELGQVDLAVYRAIAGSPTPMLDRPMRRLSAAANWSRLWIIVGGAMAVAGGRAGRRAAGAGLVAVAVDSAVVNIGFKVAARRGRPDRDSAGVPTVRRVLMPASASFPSGHTASGFAFTNAVAHTLPAAAGPLGLLASAVGYARVHTGVHYPGDVIIGAVVGTAVGEAVGWGERGGCRPFRGYRSGPSGGCRDPPRPPRPAHQSDGVVRAGRPGCRRCGALPRPRPHRMGAGDHPGRRLAEVWSIALIIGASSARGGAPGSDRAGRAGARREGDHVRVRTALDDGVPMAVFVIPERAGSVKSVMTRCVRFSGSFPARVPRPLSGGERADLPVAQAVVDRRAGRSRTG